MSAYSFGPFRLDPERLLLALAGEPLALGPKVVETLLALVERPGETLTKNELLDRIWPEGFVEESNLAQNIYVIRRVLRAHWTDVIQTVPRRGYRFAGDVIRPGAGSPAKARTVPRFYYATAAAALLALSFVLLHDTARSLPPSQQLSAAGSRLYAMGNYYWKQRTQAGVQKSIRYFKAVLATDPGNARAYAALAKAYAIEGNYGYAPLKPARAYELARSFARRAVALDSNLADAHAALGIAQDVTGTRTAARAQYRQALALDPSNASARQWYGESLLEQGREREAFAELTKAAQLDPLSVAALAWLSNAAYLSRHYSEAVTYGREALDLSPERPDAYVGMGLGYEGLRNYRAAEKAYRGYAANCGTCRGEAAALLAHAYAAAHDFTNARTQLAIARRERGMGKAEATDLAAAFVALGNRPEALTLLDEASRHVVGFRPMADARLDVVRGDPRFRKYFRKPA